MYWSIGYDENWNRDIGYDVPGICDHPDCDKSIDRGIDHVCGSEPYGGDSGCGLYFCKDHLALNTDVNSDEPTSLCDQCSSGAEPFEPTPDTEEWITYKQTSNYWAGWRVYHQNKAAG